MDAEGPFAQFASQTILWPSVVVVYRLRCMQREILLRHDFGFEELVSAEREAEADEEDRQHGR